MLPLGACVGVKRDDAGGEGIATGRLLKKSGGFEKNDSTGLEDKDGGLGSSAFGWVGGGNNV